MINKIKIFDDKNSTKRKIICAGISLALVGAVMTGCSETEKAEIEEYDTVDLNNNSDELGNGLQQVLDVPGEDFKLVANYSCDSISERAWRVTSDKFLYLNVHTEGLPEDTFVYLDNVHIDTSIKSEYAAMDGILQDTMDDRIHNTQMLGFPIGNDIYYYGVDAIEGSNEQFLNLSLWGFNSGGITYTTGNAIQKRYTEKDYTKAKVYANKFQIVYDLLIQGPNDLTPRNVSVNTDFIVPINSTLTDENQMDNSGDQKTK